ncbi:MAG TPA: sulfatase [Thermoplasmata archaeon]|nr:sulfatase [Thermoplasmata archaeon]
MSAASRPNVLVVVLDCVRASDFPGGPTAPPMPFVESLGRESIQFPNAVAPAPWTIPSHASLFTGLYPWEHGAHWRNQVTLDPSIPRLPQWLRAAGYRTLSLSANPLLSPTFRLVDGFDTAAWAGWWEPYLRFGHPERPPLSTENGGSSRAGLAKMRSGGRQDLIQRSRRLFSRYPVLLQGASRFAQGLRDPQGAASASMARWIEPTLDDWLGRRAAGEPVFVFVNLLDSHEPYFANSAEVHGALGWWRYARICQDHLSYLTGERVPNAEEIALLRRLYRAMIRGLDARLAAIVAAFRKHDRWDDSLAVITSDHGQAFGEHGMFYHMLRLDEGLLRIPLYVRLPRSEQAGAKAKGWASLIDVPGTVASACGAEAAPAPSARPLLSLVDADRGEPVLAASDGIVWKHFQDRFTEANRGRFDRVFGAAYSDDRKVVVDASDGTTAAFDVRNDPAEQRDLWGPEQSELAFLQHSASDAARRMLKSSAQELATDVEDRLRAWGYL